MEMIVVAQLHNTRAAVADASKFAYESFDEAANIFTYEISDDALEAAAGGMGGVLCSCTPCNSECWYGTKGSNM